MFKLFLFLIATIALSSATGFTAEKKGGADGSHWSELCEILYDPGKAVGQDQLAAALTPENADTTCEYEGSGNRHPTREIRFSATPFFLASNRGDAPAALQILRMGIDPNKPNSYYLHANYSVFEVAGEPNAYAALKKFAEHFSWGDAAAKSLFEELLWKRPNLSLVERNYDVKTWRTDRRASILGVLLSPWEKNAYSAKVAAYVAAFGPQKTQVLREVSSGSPDKCYDFEGTPEAHLVATRCD